MVLGKLPYGDLKLSIFSITPSEYFFNIPKLFLCMFLNVFQKVHLLVKQRRLDFLHS
jgi:hypothetical protein